MRHAVAITLVLFVTALAAAQSPNDLFQQAMLDMFDGKWSQALDKLNEVQESDAPPELKARSYFFAARALEKSGRQEDGASTLRSVSERSVHRSLSAERSRFCAGEDRRPSLFVGKEGVCKPGRRGARFLRPGLAFSRRRPVELFLGQEAEQKGDSGVAGDHVPGPRPGGPESGRPGAAQD